MSTGADAPLFRFAQFELPWELGPADGRYVLRGHAGVPTHVLVLRTLGAEERRYRKKLFGPKAPPVPVEPGPALVATARATLVVPDAFASSHAAHEWFDDVDADEEARDGIRVLNRVLHAHRTAASDPYVREIVLGQAIAVRVGIGEGEQVAHGRWLMAVSVPGAALSAAARRSESALRPQERLAAILGGRDVALACEELTLRARSDLDAARPREAALQLRVALEAALAELAPWSDREGVGRRLDELREERQTVADVANEALQGGLDEEATDEVERVLKILEAALRVRTTVGLA